MSAMFNFAMPMPGIKKDAAEPTPCSKESKKLGFSASSFFLFNSIFFSTGLKALSTSSCDFSTSLSSAVVNGMSRMLFTACCLIAPSVPVIVCTAPVLIFFNKRLSVMFFSLPCSIKCSSFAFSCSIISCTIVCGVSPNFISSDFGKIAFPIFLKKESSSTFCG